jgi:hypothetical protein
MVSNMSELTPEKCLFKFKHNGEFSLVGVVVLFYGHLGEQIISSMGFQPAARQVVLYGLWTLLYIVCIL